MDMDPKDDTECMDMNPKDDTECMTKDKESNPNLVAQIMAISDQLVSSSSNWPSIGQVRAPCDDNIIIVIYGTFIFHYNLLQAIALRSKKGSDYIIS